MTGALTVTARFSSAHFYRQPAWDDERNRREFGRCFTEYGHGHNYRAEATFEVDAESVARLRPELEGALRNVTDRLDHEHLNFVIPEFRSTVPTTENIAIYLCRQIAAAEAPARLLRLRLFEMDDLWVEVEP